MSCRSPTKILARPTLKKISAFLPAPPKQYVRMERPIAKSPSPQETQFFRVGVEA